MFLVSLGYSSMCLGVPFIAPRQLGAVGGKQGRPSLPSVEWRTGQSGGPPDSHCRRSGADLLSFLAQTTIAAPGQLAHRTLSGAHRTVRCPLLTIGAGHASPADCAADRCAGDRWRTCRCFGSDRALGVAPRGAFWSRTVLPTVARWFALDARETMGNFIQVRAALRCVTPYVLA
jgi:hypothetical protein